MISIVSQPIDTAAVLAAVSSPLAGASVLFVGTTRQFTGDLETERLSYECYEAMAIVKLEELRAQACKKWDIVECAIQHRIGEVAIGEASVAVAVSTRHRKAAFESAEWLMERLKDEVPIWKQEHWADGGQAWIHDKASPASPSSRSDGS